MRNKGLVYCLLMLVSAGSESIALSTEIVQARIDQESAWTGEAVLLNIKLFSPGPFSGTATFELPELPRTAIIKIGSPVVGSEEVDGDTWFTQLHAFNLYTQQAGKIAIPAFTVRFKGKESFTSDAVLMTGETQTLSFQSKRPPGTEQLGVVIATRQMSTGQTWTSNESDRVDAGDVIQRTITRRATGTTAMMFPPAAASAPSGVRVYSADPTVDDKTQRGDSTAKRVDTLKYQFERPGVFELPEFSFPWWDTSSDQLKYETIPGRTITVEAVASDTVESIAPATASNDSSMWLAWVLAVGILGWLFRKQSIRLVATWRSKRNSPLVVAARRLRSACQTNDAAAAYRAVLDWQRAVCSANSKLPSDHLTEITNRTGLWHQWEQLSAHLYGEHGESSTWSGQGLQVAFKKTNDALKQEKTGLANPTELPSLNPPRPSA